MIEYGWVALILAILNVFLFLSWHLYSQRKDFYDEYSPKNGQVMGVLVENFNESVSKWVSERKMKREDVELAELMESLADLFAKSERLSTWTSHINKGKSHLSSGASNMVLAGVLLASAVFIGGILFDVQSTLALTLGFVPGYFGLMCLARGIGHWRSFCAIESKIDKYHSDLALGKSLITDNDEDDAED